MMPNWPHTCRGRRPAEDQHHSHFNESTTKSATLHDRHALMSDKLSIGNKNHGNCVNNDTGTLSSRRPSAWDIWDKVFFERKRM